MAPNPTGGERRLRVVFVDHVARLSGGEIALSRLLPALAEHVDVHVVLGEEGPLIKRLRDRGIETEVITLAPRLRDVRRETVRPTRVDPRALAHLPASVLRLSRRLRALDADLVHTNSLKAALYGGVAGRIARVPVLWHVRDRIASDYLPPSAVLLVRLASRVLPAAVVANSQATLDTLPGIRSASVLYNPVVPDAVEPRATVEPRAGGTMTIGVVGRLAPWKGQDVFLDAFAHAFDGTSVLARIIGSALFGENEYAASLRQQAERLGIARQVEFRGFREDVWAELNELDVLVHCSVRPEPFGQVVLEGMAAGVPVIAAAAGGPTELITDGVDGMLTEPGDAAELAAAMRRLIDEPELRAKLAASARERSREFTPERTAARLLDVYRQVVSGSSGTGVAARRARRRRLRPH
jgi:glycosyltransferase involved in cell wall biosynthesis